MVTTFPSCIFRVRTKALSVSVRLSPMGKSDIGYLFFGPLVTSRSIGQSLSSNAHQSEIGTGNVIDAKLDAVAITEIEFCQIPMQVSLGAMLIDTLHAALEDRIIALDGVGGDEVFAFVA